jgi:hypothetical protein
MVTLPTTASVLLSPPQLQSAFRCTLHTAALGSDTARGNLEDPKQNKNKNKGREPMSPHRIGQGRHQNRAAARPIPSACSSSSHSWPDDRGAACITVQHRAHVSVAGA